jgi:hypothetical protein
MLNFGYVRQLSETVRLINQAHPDFCQPQPQNSLWLKMSFFPPKSTRKYTITLHLVNISIQAW